MLWGHSPVCCGSGNMTGLAGVVCMAGMEWEGEVSCVNENLVHTRQRKPFAHGCTVHHDQQIIRQVWGCSDALGHSALNSLLSLTLSTILSFGQSFSISPHSWFNSCILLYNTTSLSKSTLLTLTSVLISHPKIVPSFSFS